MKTAIVYATTHGCTETCAERLGSKLPGPVDRFNLKDKPEIDIAAADLVLIGGSIHAGRIQGSVRRFCSANLAGLLRKRVGLFLCCMEKGAKAQAQFDAAFPKELRDHASACGLFGGGFDFERMNFVQKAITKKVAKIDHTVMEIDDAAIGKFVKDVT
jgi:menaquinone-dependent protoporphyrinogen oxidase